MMTEITSAQVISMIIELLLIICVIYTAVSVEKLKQEIRNINYHITEIEKKLYDKR